MGMPGFGVPFWFPFAPFLVSPCLGCPFGFPFVGVPFGFPFAPLGVPWFLGAFLGSFLGSPFLAFLVPLFSRVQHPACDVGFHQYSSLR